MCGYSNTSVLSALACRATPIVPNVSSSARFPLLETAPGTPFAHDAAGLNRGSVAVRARSRQHERQAVREPVIIRTIGACRCHGNAHEPGSGRHRTRLRFLNQLACDSLRRRSQAVMGTSLYPFLLALASMALN